MARIRGCESRKAGRHRRAVLAKACRRNTGGTHGLIELLEPRVHLTVAGPIGSEFQINPYAMGDSPGQVIASNAAGDSVVVWPGHAPDGRSAIYAQQYDRLGIPHGSPISVDVKSLSLRAPGVALDADGDFVVVWTSYSSLGGDIYGTSIHGRRYNVGGDPVGTEFRVSTFALGDQDQAAVAMDAAGNFVVTWSSPNETGTDLDIRAQRFNEAGTKLGSEIRVTSNSTNYQHSPAIAMDADGDFVIAWTSYQQDATPGSGIYAKRYNAAGQLQGTEFRVNSYTAGMQYQPAVAMGSDGSFMIAWNSDGQEGATSGVYAQQYDAAAAKQGGEIRIASTQGTRQSAPTIAATIDGNFWVAWRRAYYIGADLFASLYNSHGSAEVQEIRINSQPLCGEPSITSLPSGFVAVWPSGYSTQIKLMGQRFESSSQDPASFTGRLWEDLNYNGLEDAGEGGIDAVPVTLYNAQGAFAGSTVTSASGEYQFTHLLPGQYYAELGGKDGFTLTVPKNLGSDDLIDSDIDPMTRRTDLFTVAAGQIQSHVDAGLARTASVSGFVYWDANENGLREADEIGLPGWFVFVDSNGNGAADTGEPVTATGPDGSYTIGGLTPATVAILQVPQEHWNQTGRLTVTLTSGQEMKDANLANRTLVRQAVLRAEGADYTLSDRSVNSGVPRMALDAAGNGVLVWAGLDEASASVGIYARLYDAAGQAVGGSFRVDRASNGGPNLPVVAMGERGDFVVVWQERGQAGRLHDIVGQRYSAGGVRQGEAFRINSLPSSDSTSATLAMDRQGNFVVAWNSKLADGTGWEIHAQRFSAGGEAQGGELCASPTSTTDSYPPNLAMTPGGSFVIVWDGNRSGQDRAVYARLYDAAGIPQGDEIRVGDSGTASAQPVAKMDAAGSFFVTWMAWTGTERVVLLRRFNAAGVGQGAPVRVNTGILAEFPYPTLAIDATGGAVVAWCSTDSVVNDKNILARRYTASGMALGGEFRLNNDVGGLQAYPALAMNSHEMLAAWYDYAKPTSSSGSIRARRFSYYADPATLSGRVWNDVNSDGRQNADEPLLDGVKVDLCRVDGTLLSSTTTARGGAYRFDTVQPGEAVLVRFTAPLGMQFSEQHAGSNDALDSDADGQGQTDAFFLKANGAQVDVSAGLFFPATISGTVFVDQNQNGVHDPGETGQGGVTVFRDANGNGQLDDGEPSMITMPNGAYRFDGLRAGSYRIACTSLQTAESGQSRTCTVTTAQTLRAVDLVAPIDHVLGTSMTPWGGDFRVSPDASSSQASPGAAIMPDGSSIIFWLDSSAVSLYAQLYDAAGAKLGAEFRVNTSTGNVISDPTIGIAGDSSFIMAWSMADGDTNGIYARQFDALGQPRGSEFRVNSTTQGNQTAPAAAADAHGDFVVVWSSVGPNLSTTGIFAQRYDASGTPQGSEFRVSAAAQVNQTEPSVAMDAAGNFVVGWSSAGPDSSVAGIFARRYDASGAAQGGEIHVSTRADNRQNASCIRMLAAGGFEVAWQDNSSDTDTRIHARRFDSAGIPVDSEQLITTYPANTRRSVSTAIDATGRLVVSWEADVTQRRSAIHAQWFDQWGNAMGDARRISTDTPIHQFSAAVGMDDAGNMLVVWLSAEQSSGWYAVHAQRYATSANPALVAGRAWNDSNGNSTQDSGEPGCAGVLVRLFNASGVLVSSMTTDRTGSYVLAAAPGQSYYLQYVLPAGLIFNSPDQGADDLLDSDVNPLTGCTPTFTVIPGELYQKLSAAVVPPSSISGTIFYDANANHSDEPNEMPLSSWQVYLDLNGNGQFDNGEPLTSSGPDGAYSFAGLRPGGYRIAAIPQIGWQASVGPRMVTLSPGQALSGVDVGMTTSVVRVPAIGPVGPEMHANTQNGSYKSVPAIARDKDGNYVIAWASRDGDGSYNGIYAQRYSDSGVALGDEFRVASRTRLDQMAPAVAMDGDGDFVVAWYDSSLGDVQGQRFDAEGVPQGAVFIVNTYRTGTQSNPAVAMDGNGDFVITWQSLSQDGDREGVYAQRFDASGVRQGTEFRVNSTTRYGQLNPTIAMSDQGVFTIAWQSSSQDGSGIGIYAQRYDAGGVPQGGEFCVNTYTTLDQTDPSIAADAAGNFVVAWVSKGQDGNETGVYAQRYDAAGVPQGTELRVNTSTQYGQYAPSVGMDAAGDFVIAWVGYGLDAGYGVFAQRYNAAGLKEAGEFRIGDYSAYVTPGSVSVSTKGNGDFVASWDQDGTVHAQHFTPIESPVSVSGVVWDDTNSDGIRDPLEPGHDGVAVCLLDNQGVLAASGLTANGGAYRFDNLRPGVAYHLKFLAPSNRTFTLADQEDDTRDSDVVDGSGATASFTPGPNQANLLFDAGIVRFASISGVKFNDMNGNGVMDSGEPGIAGATIYIDSNRNGQLDSDERCSISDASGAYAFYSLRPGTYRIVEVPLDHWTRTSPEPLEVSVLGGQIAKQASLGCQTDAIDTYPAAVGPSVRVNQTGAGGQYASKVARDSVGNYVLVWHSDAPIGSPGREVFAQRFTAAGMPAGSVLRIADRGCNPSVAMAASGAFAVTWIADAVTYGDIFAQLYAPDGQPATGVFRVTTGLADNQLNPALTMDADGNFVVAWTEHTATSRVVAQRFDATGSRIGDSFIVAPDSAQSPSVAMEPDGDFVIAWQGPDTDIYARRYKSDGSTWGDTFRVNSITAGDQTNVSVATSSAGDFIFAWQSVMINTTPLVYYRRFNAAGIPQGSDLRVNQEAAANQKYPAVAMDAAGNFAVTWNSNASYWVRRFSAAGTSIGPDLCTNGESFYSPGSPAIAMGSNGDFTVAWSGVPAGENYFSLGAQSYQNCKQFAPVGGRLWSDANGNGVYDAGEQGVKGLRVELLNEAGGVAGAAMTDNAGQYRFDYVAAGQRYRVRLGTTAGWVLTAAHQGIDDACNSDFDVQTRQSPLFTAGAGGGITMIDAGLVTPRQISGFTFNDLDGDGVREPGENALSGWTVFVDADRDGQLDVSEQRSVSDASGAFAFGSLNIGAHRLGVVPQDAWTLTTPAVQMDIVVTAARHVTGVPIAFHTDVCDTALIPVGKEFLVNTTRTGRQYLGGAAMSSGGDYVITWTTSDDQDSPQGVYAQRFTADGQKVGAEIRVDPNAYQSNLPAVAMAPSGHFVVVWQQGVYDCDLYAQRFSATGAKIGAPIRVSPEDSHKHKWPSVAMDADGDFVVAWESGEQTGESPDIYVRQFRSNGAPVTAAFQVNGLGSGMQYSAQVAMDAAGNYMVTWASDGTGGKGIYAQRFDSQGKRSGAEFQIAANTAPSAYSLAMNSDGDAVVAYALSTTIPGGGTQTAIGAARFNSAGIRQGQDLSLSTSATSNQRPIVAIDSSGCFVITWDQVYPEPVVLAQRYNAAGLRQGGIFQVSTSRQPTNWSGPRAAAMDADGHLVVAWQTWGSNSTLEDIRAQRYQLAPACLQGSPDSDSYYVRRSPITGDVEIFHNATPDQPAAVAIPLAQLPSLAFNGLGGSDKLTIDFTAGNPIPTGGLFIDGGNFTLDVIGAPANVSWPLSVRNDAAVSLTSFQNFSYLNLSGSSRVSLTAGGNTPLRTAALSIDPTATLDLADNDLIVTATPETKTAVLAALSTAIKSARGSDVKWTGTGLGSSAAGANKQTGLAVMLNDKAGKAILTTFAGQSVGVNDILVKYTWDGDVNLDGVVDAADYFLVDSGFITQAGQYRNGDLNLDGVVDVGDYFLIDSAFVAQTSMLAAEEAPVPAEEGGVLKAEAAKPQQTSSVLQQLFSVKPVL